jgi:hypothetical protein
MTRNVPKISEKISPKIFANYEHEERIFLASSRLSVLKYKKTIDKEKLRKKLEYKRITERLESSKSCIV